ncbi:MAG: pyridoxal-phosphate dependent enzyme [Sphingomonadaceae bacterium]|uniref:pyridoxal-phosphate dependent enzyme n=1 Tax=Thermaurantiacus sp. TaxID=2820283 RepID=UPI00298F1C2D|nr:pyridoxal-phosphate dependent enzyme [Thermaurantiacus sp.]MCS6987488.1 pyridoxal-phosphate dependent enzyme [Sphingomonadaceae bacterium]MDW8415408.1 pyridoxal-phosphate dependent enzyme [Thermaurantiacus sp.]
MVPPPELDAILEAHRRIRPHLHRTPILSSRSVDAATGANCLFKCENFQRTGSFKVRGALNAALGMPDGVPEFVTHSSGNHAAALAFAARLAGRPAHVAMPVGASAAKKAAAQAYGARVVECEPTLAAREAAAAQLVAETGGRLVPPFDSTDVVAGQGTCALEFVEDAGRPLDLLLVPVGGGGLLAGTLIAMANLSPTTRVVGVEPEAADDAARGFRCGIRQPQVLPVRTMADGAATAMSEMTFTVMNWLAHDIVTVPEDSIARAMRFVWERLKIVIEPTCALPVAALLEGILDVRGQTVGVILTGGNVDLDRLPWLAPRPLPT